MDRNAAAQEALHNALTSPSMANYGAIFQGFQAKGIPADDIKPRENVFTFHAWKALGRSVRKGEHGVKVCTWIPMSKKDENGEAQPIGRKPRMTTVFHVSQTDPYRTGDGRQFSHQQAAVEHANAVADKSGTIIAVERAPAESYYSEEFTRV